MLPFRHIASLPVLRKLPVSTWNIAVDDDHIDEVMTSIRDSDRAAESVVNLAFRNRQCATFSGSRAGNFGSIVGDAAAIARGDELGGIQPDYDDVD